MTSRIVRFLFSHPKLWGTYAFVPLRIIVAAFWLHSDIPRWVVLAASQPEANGFVRNLFGVGLLIPLTYFFTALETLAAISFILGFMIRFASVWAVIEFTIISTPLLLSGNLVQALVHLLLLCASLVLLLNGSPTLSIDGLIARRLKIT